VPENLQSIADLGVGSAIRFNNQANSILDFRDRVCPANGNSFFGFPGACPAADLVMLYEEEVDTCRVVHVVHVYLRGLVHYFAAGLAGSDQYSEVPSATAARLRQVATAYTITRHEGLDGDLQSPRFGTDAELLSYRDLLTSEAGIKFLEIGSSDSRCKTRTDTSDLQREISIPRE
jgi:hypothetical protein